MRQWSRLEIVIGSCYYLDKERKMKSLVLACCILGWFSEIPKCGLLHKMFGCSCVEEIEECKKAE